MGREVWPNDSFGHAGMSPEEELETLHMMFMKIQGACMNTYSAPYILYRGGGDFVEENFTILMENKDFV